MNDLSSRSLLSLLQAGNVPAAEAVFDRYVTRLLAMARRRLSKKLNRRVDADDIVQSAYRSFFVHALNGDYVLKRAGDLWRLLAKITLHKLYGQVQLPTALKRDIQREENFDFTSSSLPTADIADIEPSPDEVAEVIEQVRLAMEEMSLDQRAVLELRLAGATIEQIADAVRRSERTVRRLLEQTRTAIERRLDD